GDLTCPSRPRCATRLVNDPDIDRVPRSTRPGQRHHRTHCTTGSAQRSHGCCRRGTRGQHIIQQHDRTPYRRHSITHCDHSACEVTNTLLTVEPGHITTITPDPQGRSYGGSLPSASELPGTPGRQCPRVRTASNPRCRPP